MCGITGAVDFTTAEPITTEVLDSMCKSIEHRGPDGTRKMLRQHLAFGHTRLSVIDTEGGWQPISNEDNSIYVILNGEIYNYQKLRRSLEKLGHTFKTASDTEVIVHLYEERENQFVKELDGMFAIAIFDERKKRLVLARDRIGKKPLFYSIERNQLIFASELKALQPALKSREINHASLREYLTYGYVGAPSSILDGVQKLPPGNLLEFSQNGRKIERYWNLDSNIDSDISFEEACSQVRERVDQAVKSRQISDVPLGFFLSGGIDSSITVASAATTMARTLKTFSIGFEEQSFSELPHARNIAERFSTEHEEFIVKPDLIGDISNIVKAADEPFADSSMIPMYYLSRQTRKHVTVAISGDGGDEAFSGYDRYYGISLAENFYRTPHLIRRGLIGPIACRIPEQPGKRSNLRRLKRLAFPAMASPDEWYRGWMQQFRVETHNDVFTTDFMKKDSVSEWRDRNIALFTSKEPGDRRARLADIGTYLPNDLMVKADRMSMAFALEVRSPFLDHRLLEFSSSLPEKYLRSNRNGKRILKAAYADLIPPEIANRPKEGFTVPIATWINGPLKSTIRDHLLAGSAQVSRIVEPTYIDRMLYEHTNMKHDHSIRLWNLFCLETWANEFRVTLS